MFLSSYIQVDKGLTKQKQIYSEAETVRDRMVSVFKGVQTPSVTTIYITAVALTLHEQNKFGVTVTVMIT